MSTEVWRYLKDFAAHALQPGMTTETSLLGRVTATKIGGELVGDIPEWLQREARENGFVVEAADFRNGSYVLRYTPGRSS